MAEVDKLLIQEIRSGADDAWMRFVDRFSGRLQAFVRKKIRDSATVEDIVQETFIGFINSLPNFDESRPIDSFLFTICRYRIIDHFKKTGRRPDISSLTTTDSQQQIELPDAIRGASTIYRSGERRRAEENALLQILQQEVTLLIENEAWIKLACLELIFVSSTPNKEIAELLQLSQPQVASFKHEFVDKIKRQMLRLGVNADLFPELYPDQQA
ncbi:MAG: RNA polymerase sigma factor [Planctomycetaceae bacterium]|nr:RNA polymerase subunit sigma-70 [Planctomycetaceae bacterium]|tara:strand:+ start:2576 stop:3217 length:642 start_codon:yes stop_codon:yes gene_type:complete